MQVRVDFVHQAVTIDGVAVVLTPTEYRLLATLVRHQGQVLSPDQLIELAWDDPTGLAPSRVKYAILRLRRKLGWGEQDDSPIETVRGFGYRYRTRAM
jgi:DNA-binding response OmpR family regulator